MASRYVLIIGQRPDPHIDAVIQQLHAHACEVILLDRYALCICSGDFNEGVWKLTSVTSKYSFMFDDSYDLYEFNFGDVINYAELANLMVPRPFMVERGHSDAVSIDPWVAYEYSKVKQHYDHLDLSDRTKRKTRRCRSKHRDLFS